ncbi:Hypothetical predicted protein [Marmota monax]|uniref:Uncharacterized protein n=1 Tax=Marmota monax TaxID=9995 RepID=A0A5E4AIP2_MARMO|nr:hypothetical protein GHT09_019509 [Marmota monax]VTJ57065.1 Hypothetical predicted protein [Marmota monax]
MASGVEAVNDQRDHGGRFGALCAASAPGEPRRSPALGPGSSQLSALVFAWSPGSIYFLY